jgi:hypothetical protein
MGGGMPGTCRRPRPLATGHKTSCWISDTQLIHIAHLWIVGCGHVDYRGCAVQKARRESMRLVQPPADRRNRAKIHGSVGRNGELCSLGLLPGRGADRESVSGPLSGGAVKSMPQQPSGPSSDRMAARSSMLITERQYSARPSATDWLRIYAIGRSPPGSLQRAD